jgi:hypothetical protein
MLIQFVNKFQFCYLCGGTLGTGATTGLLYQPRMMGDGDCGEIGRMKIGRGIYVCIRGGPQKPAVAPRPLKIYCASSFD